LKSIFPTYYIGFVLFLPHHSLGTRHPPLEGAGQGMGWRGMVFRFIFAPITSSDERMIL
jgi:hypothetical protein